MSRFPRIFMWVLLIAAVFIAVAYFLPRTVYVERTARIEAAPKLVYAQIMDLHSWNQWSKWNQIDPDIKIEYINNGAGVGAGYRWESMHKSVGNGSITIIDAVPFDSIQMELEFEGQGTASSSFILKEVDQETELTWTLNFDLGNNPISRWMGMMIKKSVGNDYETGLSQLNALCSVLQKEKEFVILLDELDAFTYASIRQTVPFIEVSLKMGEMYGEIGQFLAEQEIDMAGMPLSFYHLMAEDEIDLECAIPTTKKVIGNKRIIAGEFPKTRCVTLDYYGDYTDLGRGHEKLQKWLEEHDFELVGAPMELYLSDPGEDENPENWLTRICYPVE